MTCKPCYSIEYNPLIKDYKPYFLGLKKGISMCCKILNVLPESLKNESKIRAISEPRQMIMSVLSYGTRFSLKEIGQQFGGRDYTTVIHAKKIVQNLCRTQPEYKERYDYFEAQVNNFIKQI